MMDISRLSRVIIFEVPTFFLVLGIVNLKPSTNKAAIALGDSSYGTYLVQILTIPLFFKTIHIYHLINLSGEALGLASVLFTVLIGHFLFWKIEKYLDSQIYQRIRLEKERKSRYNIKFPSKWILNRPHKPYAFDSLQISLQLAVLGVVTLRRFHRYSPKLK